MNSHQKQYYQAFGILPWERRDINRSVNLMIIVDDHSALLQAMINSMGLTHRHVHITKYTENLDQQITAINPNVILAMGETNAYHLLKTKSSLESLRNKIHYYNETHIPLIITYDPADLSCNPKNKQKAFIDLQLTKKTLSL